MSFNIAYNVQLEDQFSAVSGKINGAMEKIKRKARQVSASIKRVGDSMQGAGQAAAVRFTLPVLGIGAAALKASADMEKLQVSFESITGSAETAKTIMEGLAQFSAKTPFQLEGIGRAAKQLLAASVSVEDLQDRLKVLGDIASGADVPLSDIASIFAKIKNKGKAMTEEILQFSDRGIPIIDVLSKHLNVSKEQVFELASQGKLSFDIMRQSLEKMTSEGGIFFNQMQKQSGTLAGVFSTLKDNVKLAFGAFGDVIVDSFQLKQVVSTVISKIASLTEKFKQFAKVNPELTKKILLFTGLAVVIPPVLIGIGLLIKAFGLMFAAVGLLFKPITALWSVGLVAAKAILFMSTAMKTAAVASVLLGKRIWFSLIPGMKGIVPAVKRAVMALFVFRKVSIASAMSSVVGFIPKLRALGAAMLSLAANPLFLAFAAMVGSIALLIKSTRELIASLKNIERLSFSDITSGVRSLFESDEDTSQRIVKEAQEHAERFRKTRATSMSDEKVQQIIEASRQKALSAETNTVSTATATASPLLTNKQEVTSSAKIELNVNDPSGVVRSAQSKSDGPLDMAVKLGANMMPAT